MALPPFQFITAIPPQYLTPVCGGIGQIGIRRYGNVAWFGARTPPHNIEHHRTIVRQPRPTWTLRFRHKRNAAFLALSERTAKVWRRCAVGRHSSSHRRHMDKVRPTLPFRPPTNNHSKSSACEASRISRFLRAAFGLARSFMAARTSSPSLLDPTKSNHVPGRALVLSPQLKTTWWSERSISNLPKPVSPKSRREGNAVDFYTRIQ